MKVCFVFFLAALVAISNIDRNSALPVTSSSQPSHPSTGKPVGVIKNFFFFNKANQTTAQPSLAPELAPVNGTRAGNATGIPVGVAKKVFLINKANRTTVQPSLAPELAPVNGTRPGNATAFQDPTCLTSGHYGCEVLCQTYGFFNGACDFNGFCSCF